METPVRDTVRVLQYCCEEEQALICVHDFQDPKMKPHINNIQITYCTQLVADELALLSRSLNPGFESCVMAL